jgi:hypothetical protein
MINSPQSSWSFFITPTAQKGDKKQDSPAKTVKSTRKITRFRVKKITRPTLGFMLKISSKPPPLRLLQFISPL